MEKPKYYITTPIIFKFLENATKLKSYSLIFSNDSAIVFTKTTSENE